MALYQSLHLYASPDAFTLAPVFADPAIPRESLVIRRTDGAVLLNAPPSPTLGQEEVTVIHGVLGIIRLNAGDYLVVATDRRRIGSLGGHEVFVLTSHRVMSVRKSQTHITDRQIRDDATYLAMLSELLDGKAFYFSYTYDLTHTVQRRAQMGRLESLPMWQRADERFFWNRFLQSPLISITQRDPVRNNLSRFILPIICGFVSITNLSVHARPISFALVSRRSQYRAGTRYHSRGIDERGHVSNFVETEQIVEVEGAGLRASYVQTRGSIPLFWRQLVGVRYPPRLVIENKPSTSTAFRNHFYEQFKLYGQQIVVNLINKQGYEGPLGVAFARQVLDLKDERLRFIHFDFHEHCRNMRWDRISILVSAIKEDLDEQGYCAVDARNALVKEQVSSVRTNCIDCLDRTNVVQSVLGRRMLERQLRDLGLFAETEQISDIADLERIFKNVWADNADAISVQYSSTGALKTDFTRTGKRSTGGALQDFANTMMRYVKNNFLDGFRQDAIDLFVGRYQVDPSRESPFANQLVTPRTILIPMLLILAGFVAVFALVMPQTTATTAWCLAVALAMALAAVRLMDTYSDEFVSRPQLVPDCAVLAQLGLRGLNATMCCNADLGVTCDPPAPASPTAAAAVVNIDMTSKGLSGPLPRDWSALRMAQSIALPGNAFTGSIPDSFGTLTSLISLDLSNNKLTGMIPASFAQLKSLKFLALANNPGLNGNLPDGFSITRLENCDFSGTPLCQSAIPSKCCTVNGKHPAMLRCGLLSPKTVSSASPTPTASADQPSSGSSNSIVGIVAGAAAGGAILIIAIVGALMFLYDRRKRQQEMEFRGAANNRSLSRATRTPVFDEDPLPPEERPPLPRTGSQSSRRMSFAASGLGTLGRRSSAGGSQVGQTQGSSVKGSVPPPLPPVAFSQDARSPGASQSARSADPLMSAGYSGSVVSQGSPFAKSPMTEPSLVGSQHSAQSFFFPPSQTGAAQRAGISGSQALSSIYSATSLEDSADYAYPAQPQSSYRGGSR